MNKLYSGKENDRPPTDVEQAILLKAIEKELKPSRDIDALLWIILVAIVAALGIVTGLAAYEISLFIIKG